MKRRVGIIGTGWVGSSVAISTLQSGAAVTELLLHDVLAELAEGEAMDLAHGAAFYPATAVRTASVKEMADADAVVIAAGDPTGRRRCKAGRASKPGGEVRGDLGVALIENAVEARGNQRKPIMMSAAENSSPR
jgi:malate/lactate dehydrogenase